MDAVETEPQRPLAAAESELDGLPAQRLGLAVEERFGGERCLVARAGRAPRRIARPPLLEWPPRPPCWLFLQRIYSHTHLLCIKSGPPRAAISPQDAITFWQFDGRSFPIKAINSDRGEDPL
jgi:hypothetical protein